MPVARMQENGYFTSLVFFLKTHNSHVIMKKKHQINSNWNRRWSWSSSTLATWCEELTHLKRPWCWQRLKAGGDRDGRGWDGWMASLTQWTWVWVNSGSWWWTGRPGVLQSTGSQRVGHDWETELNWTPTIVWPQAKQQGGNTAPPINRKLD